MCVCICVCVCLSANVSVNESLHYEDRSPSAQSHFRDPLPASGDKVWLTVALTNFYFRKKLALHRESVQSIFVSQHNVLTSCKNTCVFVCMQVLHVRTVTPDT